MAKRAPRKKNVKEMIIIAFVVICSVLILVGIGNNLVHEINYVNEMKTLEAAR